MRVRRWLGPVTPATGAGMAYAKASVGDRRAARIAG